MGNRIKLIHCADLHLDSAMETHLSKEKARERKAEILGTFSDMVDYAVRNNIGHILIAGDMFDKKSISATARNFVHDRIVNNPGITFYYLKGNHDSDGFLNKLDAIPDNLITFSDTWKSIRISNGHHGIVLTAVELSPDNSSTIYNSLMLDPDDFNIVMLHGQDADYKSRDKAEIIALSELKNKSIDYLALGHVHSYKYERLDARGSYCYPGCLEGRGFDECGRHGFTVIDVDCESGHCVAEPVVISKRNTYEAVTDVTGLETSAEIIGRVRDTLAASDITADDLVKIVLSGEVSLDCEKDISLIAKQFEPDYYFVKCTDRTRIHIDYTRYQHDKSLKGEFVRSVMTAPDLTDDERAIVIRYGIRALSGEEID